ncbi:MAG: N-6 DNA methylase [Candidatus Helarchaeota archaeon]|nr:N-6 DNA methylase [Candidatus Helarchaeota archaeon]
MEHLKKISQILKKNLEVTTNNINLLKNDIYPYFEIEKDLEIKELIGFEIVIHLLIYHIFSILNKNIKNVFLIEDLHKNIDEFLKNNDFAKAYFHSEILKIMFDEKNREIINQAINHVKNINKNTLMELENIDIFFQELLSTPARKRYAANYTHSKIAELLVMLTLKDTTQKIIDPFVGSGRLLLEIYRQIFSTKRKKSNLPQNHLNLLGIDILFPAIQLAFINFLISTITQSSKNTNFNNIQLIKGDTFRYFQLGLNSFVEDSSRKYFHTFDLVIMNPPFTRYIRLEKNYKKLLKTGFQDYSKFIGSQMGLHGYALFLADKLLNDNGMIAAVLPASTFYSEYSQGIQDFFLKFYQIKYIISSQISKSFSDGSDFREILFICQKRGEPRQNYSPIKLISLKKDINSLDIDGLNHLIRNSNSNIDSKEFKLTLLSTEDLSRPENWNIYLNYNPLNEIFLAIKERAVLLSGTDLKLNIIRGFEMYGPEFFFFPNKYWRIVADKKNYIIIFNEALKRELKINKKYLDYALRQPKLYKNHITPEVNDFILNIPPTSQFSREDDIVEYINWGDTIEIPAKKRFGKKWLSHINSQFKSKNPVGRTFIVDKFSVTSVALLSYFFDDYISASKNFYLVKGSSRNLEKFVSAWLNSSIFLSIFLIFRREIGGSYGRLQIVDYLNYPLFIEINQANEFFKKILETFDKLRKIKLPILIDQLSLKERNDLDFYFLRYMGFNEKNATDLLLQLYSDIKQEFDKLQIRDSKKTN